MLLQYQKLYQTFNMAYRPLPSMGTAQKVNTTSFMAKSGMNLRELPQLLDPNSALLIKNYQITADGGLQKRKGIWELFDGSSATAITSLEKWTDDLYLFGYKSTYLGVYNISAGTITDIKTDFNTTVTSIQRYGDYAFVASPEDKIGRVSFTLDYDTQTANFATGLVLTGGTSGATAIILEEDKTYTPAFLTGDTDAQSTPATWAAVSDGSFAITINGNAYNIDAIDFTGDTTMANVATTLQAAIRTATSSTETCVWSTDHFIISSVLTTSSSAITVTSTSGGVVGTDISGAGGADWMDADTGNGTVTAKVQDTGTLTLGNISGTFSTAETITDSATGSAKADGVVGYTYTEVTNAPKARVIKVVDTRLFAGDLEDNRSAVKYCDVDVGTNPPFTTWTVGTGATQSGLLSYRNAGNVNVIENLGAVIVVGCDEGKWAFNIDTIDSAGTLSKVDNTVMYRLDAGMKAAIQTDGGVFYVNAEGLWQLVSVGQSNIAFSDQEALISEQLGDTFFDNANFDNASIVKDDKTNQLLVTYREDSSVNNQVLAYNTQLKAFAIFTGWNVREFMNDEGIIYAGGAATSKVYQIFRNNDDDGNDIWYEYEQELNVGQLWTRKELLGEYIQGELSPGTSPVLKFSIYDKDGNFIEDKLELQWNHGTSDLTARGYGELSWGDPVGGDVDIAGAMDNFAGLRAKIKNFQRIRINISGHDKESHTVNWVSLQTKEKLPIRRRNLQNVTG